MRYILLLVIMFFTTNFLASMKNDNFANHSITTDFMFIDKIIDKLQLNSNFPKEITNIIQTYLYHLYPKRLTVCYNKFKGLCFIDNPKYAASLDGIWKKYVTVNYAYKLNLRDTDIPANIIPLVLMKNNENHGLLFVYKKREDLEPFVAIDPEMVNQLCVKKTLAFNITHFADLATNKENKENKDNNMYYVGRTIKKNWTEDTYFGDTYGYWPPEPPISNSIIEQIKNTTNNEINQTKTGPNKESATIIYGSDVSKELKVFYDKNIALSFIDNSYSSTDCYQPTSISINYEHELKLKNTDYTLTMKWTVFKN